LTAPAHVVVAVASGKGGVGKSTISLNLALALSAEGWATGLLDADLYGPDIPLMVGITRRQPAKSVTVWRNPRHRRPIEPLERFGIKVVSTQFLVAEDQALSWSAPLVQLLLQRFTQDIAWGEIEFLVIDMPPGTADIQQQLARHLDLSGALVLLEQTSVPIIGGVENMSGLLCPSCQTVVDVFPPVAPERSVWATGVERLASIPIHPFVSGERGRPLLVEHPESPQATAMRLLARRLRSWADQR